MPEDSQSCLYRSIHGIILCRDHAFGLTIQELADEEWARVPDSQTRGHLCQRCVPDAPLLRHDSDPKEETWVIWHPGSASPHLVRFSRSDPTAHRVVAPDLADSASTGKRAKKG
jgi:hypothetical protein